MMRRGELSMNPPEATGQVAEQVPHWMQVLIGLPFEAYSKWLISSTKDIGFSGGTEMGLYCIAVYVIVQTIDGNVIVPMVAKRTADLAPALVLAAQLVFGLLFGILGLMLADPIVAMIKIALERQAARNDANRVTD